MTAATLSTRDKDCPPTIAVDPGYWIGVCVRVGNRPVNYGTIAPDDDATLRYRRDPKRSQGVRWYDLLDRHVERVLEVVDWAADEYAHLAVDDAGEPGRWTFAVEQFEGLAGFETMVTRRLADVLTARLRAEMVPPRSHGALYLEGKGGTGRWLDYYPPQLVGRRREYGEPGADDAPLFLIPNQHPDRKRVHEQAAFDIAWSAHADRVRQLEVAA